MVREYMLELGYKEGEINKIINTYGVKSLVETTLLQHVKDIFELLLSLGYSKQEIMKMTVLLPQLYGLSIENIKQKLIDLKSLGYSKKEIMKMTVLHPALYGYSIENIRQKQIDLESLGYSTQEVIKMTVSLPSLYSTSIENIREKIFLLRMLDLEFVVMNDTRQLMQSVDLTYARYCFLKENGIEITQTNYRKLFYDAKKFEKQYSIDKEQLLRRYPYDAFQPEKAKGILHQK